MADQLLAFLESMGQLLLAMDTGVGLLIGVGLSMSASHLFALLANRLSPRQILMHMVVDALVLCESHGSRPLAGTLLCAGGGPLCQ